jgi:hypothetical protein
MDNSSFFQLYKRYKREAEQDRRYQELTRNSKDLSTTGLEDDSLLLTARPSTALQPHASDDSVLLSATASANLLPQLSVDDETFGDRGLKWGQSLPDVNPDHQDSVVEYIKPADGTPRIGNSAYFKPADEALDSEAFKEKLGFDIFAADYIGHDSQALPVIEEASFDDDDEELVCFEFDEEIHEEDNPFSKRGSAALSPKRSITSFSFDETSILDDDFIDVGSITEATEQTKATKRYFKQRWWLINPDRWPKRYWDNLVALMIVENIDPDLCCHDTSCKI